MTYLSRNWSQLAEDSHAKWYGNGEDPDYHKLQLDNIAGVCGTVQIALCDARSDSPTQGEVNVFHAGAHNPILVHVPALVCHGFENVGLEEAIIVNTVSEPYRYDEPDEYRVHPHDNDIPHDWERHDG